MDKAEIGIRCRDAALDAVKQFPIDVESIEHVSVSENVTYRVTAIGSDVDYVLRLHRPGYNTIEELESERAWTRALKEKGIAVPESVQTKDGGHFTLISIDALGEQRYAGLTTWLEGELLLDYLEKRGDERARYFGKIGEFIATMHDQAADWETPSGFTRPRLDIDGFLGESPRWGRFWEHPELSDSEQALLRQAREQLREALDNYGVSANNFSLVHADWKDDNIVVNNDELSLIDFDDCAFSWHMYDIATAMDDEIGTNDFEIIRDAVLDGYRRCRPLADQDADMLDTFLLVRGLAIIGWLSERPEHAGSSYFHNLKDWVFSTVNRGHK